MIKTKQDAMVIAERERPSHVLYEERFVCIVDHDHPRIGSELTAELFCREPHAVMQPPNNVSSFESLAMSRLGIVREVDATTFSFASLPYLVARTERIAVVHSRIARDAARHLPVRMVEPSFELPAMRQSMQSHTYRTKDPAIVWLKEMLHEAAAMPD